MKKLNLAMMTIAVLISTTARAQEGWQIEVVATSGTKPELALDSQGRPHLTYMTEAMVGAVFYASRDGSDSWEIEEVSEGYFYTPMDIVIDGADNIHIAYHDHDFEDLAYAFKLDGQWNVETISHQGHDGWDPSLAIAPDGTVHVIAIDPEQFGTDAGVEWFSRTSGQWRVEGIGSGAIPYEFGTGLAMDAEGRLHAVDHDGDEQLRATGGGNLLYAALENDTWFIEQVDTEGDVGKFASLALDSSGHPHIAYMEWTSRPTGRVKYAHHDGESWEIESIDDLEDIEIGHLGARRMTEVALDGQDRVYLAYADRGVMKFAHQTAEGGWMIEEITRPQESGFVLAQFATLAVEESGRPHITYYELPSTPRSSTGIIYYAVGPAPPAPTAILDDSEATPAAFELGHSFPNPFNADMAIPFTLPFDGSVEIAVFNLAGQQVRIIEQGAKKSGHHTAHWDGRDGAGDEAASGVYTIRMIAGEFDQVRKALLVR